MTKSKHQFSGFPTPEDAQSYFRGQTAILATMHGKEQAIGPVLEDSLGLKVVPSSRLDTDVFGTFAGEVERPAPQTETAVMKARACLEHHPESNFALASEGAFYGHPESPFLTVNTEIVLLLDRQTGLQVAGYHHSLDTMASGRYISSIDELREFAKAAGFPKFGLILKINQDGKFIARKDFPDIEAVEAAYQALSDSNGKVMMETDLRAHRNPTRMEKIKEATKDLVRRLLSLCPHCGYPDFVVKDFEKGLPCERCKMPTRMPLKDLLHCRHCDHRAEIVFPKGETAYAGHCDWCNP